MQAIRENIGGLNIELQSTSQEGVFQFVISGPPANAKKVQLFADLLTSVLAEEADEKIVLQPSKNAASHFNYSMHFGSPDNPSPVNTEAMLNLAEWVLQKVVVHYAQSNDIDIAVEDTKKEILTIKKYIKDYRRNIIPGTNQHEPEGHLERDKPFIDHSAFMHRIASTLKNKEAVIAITELVSNFDPRGINEKERNQKKAELVDHVKELLSSIKKQNDAFLPTINAEPGRREEALAILAESIRDIAYKQWYPPKGQGNKL